MWLCVFMFVCGCVFMWGGSVVRRFCGMCCWMLVVMDWLVVYWDGVVCCSWFSIWCIVGWMVCGFVWLSGVWLCCCWNGIWFCCVWFWCCCWFSGCVMWCVIWFVLGWWVCGLWWYRRWVCLWWGGELVDGVFCVVYVVWSGLSGEYSCVLKILWLVGFCVLCV